MEVIQQHNESDARAPAPCQRNFEECYHNRNVYSFTGHNIVDSGAYSTPEQQDTQQSFSPQTNSFMETNMIFLSAVPMKFVTPMCMHDLPQYTGETTHHRATITPASADIVYRAPSTTSHMKRATASGVTARKQKKHSSMWCGGCSGAPRSSRATLPPPSVPRHSFMDGRTRMSTLDEEEEDTVIMDGDGRSFVDMATHMSQKRSRRTSTLVTKSVTQRQYSKLMAAELAGLTKGSAVAVEKSRVRGSSARRAVCC
eukprot:GHVO01044079.1.p1 GENE.GHVO01044079.1~~GHVO01044079.1.p1  ORF type:complete len:267 (+),score=36.72 GHVO01044079.1:34-801(+)